MRIFLILLIGVTFSTSSLTGPVETKKVAAMDVKKFQQIQEPSEMNDYSLAQVEELSRIVNSVARVIEKASTPENEYPVLGNLKYHHPKNPGKPITLVFFHPSEFQGTGSFDRVNDKSDWHEGGLLFGEQQRPYRLGLTKIFFSKELGLVLESAALEKRKQAPLPEYNVFYFRRISGPENTLYIFESRPDASDLRDGYPKSFHKVTVIDKKFEKSLAPKAAELPLITRKSGEICPQTGFWKANSTDAKYWDLEGLQRTAPMFVNLGEPMPKMTTSWEGAPESKEKSIVWTWVKDGK